jgi:SAM-dependent methyltransferase
MSTTDLGQFGKIDQTGDPGHFVRFLDAACAEESFRIYKRQLMEWMAIEPGDRLLDVGCGTGDDVREMALAASARCEVIGVDNSVAMIEEAKRRGIPANVEFHVADAAALPFAGGSFAASRADRSLMHVADVRKSLVELVRVTHGRVVVYEVDFETVVIDVPDRVLARKVIRTWCDGFRDCWLGRRMPGLFADVGLTNVQVVPHVLRLTPTLALAIMGRSTTERAVTAGTITPAEAEGWLGLLDELQQRSRFFATLTGFLVVGTSGKGRGPVT